MNKTLRTFLIGGSLPNTLAGDVGFTVLRVFTGIALAFGHGWRKLPPSEGFISNVGELGFPAPTLFAWAAVLSEFAGGLLLAIGLLTRPAAFFIFFTMMVAAFRVHWHDPFFATGGGASKEFALLFGSVAFAFLLAGSGRFSVDSVIRQ